MATSFSLGNVAAWFTPPRMLESREMKTRVSIFVIGHLFSPILGIVTPVYLYFIDPKAGAPLAVLSASIACFWLFPFMVKVLGRYSFFCHLSIQNLLFAILWCCHFYGGASSPFLPWLVAAPFLAFFYLGSDAATIAAVLAQIGLSFAAFVAFEVLGGGAPRTLPPEAIQGVGMVSLISAACAIATTALFASKILASQAELEREIGQHLKTSEALRRATLLTERAGVAKSAFLARAGHELREPLEAVIGCSEALIEDVAKGPEAEVLADVRRIHRAGKRLLGLVTAIIDISTIDAGGMDIFPARVDLAKLVASVVDRWRGALSARGGSVALTIVGEASSAVVDVAKATRILNLLIENAARASNGGNVEVFADLRGGAGKSAAISVRDFGAGLGANELERLFDPFGDVDDAGKTRPGAVGLELPLCKRLCALLGGELTAASELGKGTTILAKLPLGPQRQLRSKDRSWSAAA